MTVAIRTFTQQNANQGGALPDHLTAAPRGVCFASDHGARTMTARTGSHLCRRSVHYHGSRATEGTALSTAATTAVGQGGVTIRYSRLLIRQS